MLVFCRRYLFGGLSLALLAAGCVDDALPPGVVPDGPLSPGNGGDDDDGQLTDSDGFDTDDGGAGQDGGRDDGDTGDGDDDDDDEPLDCSANAMMLERAQTALDDWDIGLDSEIVGTSRALGDDFTAHNPTNWVSITSDDCSGIGIPDSLQGGACPLTGGVIGVCQTRALTDGTIVDTTAIMLDTFQSGAETAVEKQSVFTHEIGHCLGLDHSGNLTDIMYPDTSGADSPSIGELAAVAEAYDPVVQEPSAQTADDYFIEAMDSSATRHGSFPEFPIFQCIGDGSNSAIQHHRQSKFEPIPVSGPLVVINHLVYADGRCAHEVVEPRGPIN